MKRFSAQMIISRYLWRSTQKLGLESRLSIGSRVYKVIQFGQIFFRVLGRNQLIPRFLEIQLMCALIEINGAGLQSKMTLVFDTILLTWHLRVPLLLSLTFCLLEVEHRHSSLSYTFWHYRFLFTNVHANSSKIHIHIYSIRLNTVLLLNIPRISNFIWFDLNCFVSLVIREKRLFYFRLTFYDLDGLEVLVWGRTRR